MNFFNCFKRWPCPDSTRTSKISPGKRSTHEFDSDSDYVEEDEEEEIGQEGNLLADMEKLTEEGLVRPVPKKVGESRITQITNEHSLTIQAKWACEVPASQMKSEVNHNQHITDKLEVC